MTHINAIEQATERFNNLSGEDVTRLKELNKSIQNHGDIEVEPTLKLTYTATRKERFADGSLVWAFEAGGFPKLIDRLVSLRMQRDEQ